MVCLRETTLPPHHSSINVGIEWTFIYNINNLPLVLQNHLICPNDTLPRSPSNPFIVLVYHRWQLVIFFPPLEKWRHCLQMLCFCVVGWEFISLKGNSKICCHRSFPPDHFQFPSRQSFIMREVISLHVGQAGVQIGNACCECRSYLLSRALLTSIRGTLHPRAWLERTCSLQRISSVGLIIFLG